MADDQAFHGLLGAAAAFAEQLASSTELAQAIGEISAQLLRTRAYAVRAALASVDSPAGLVPAVAELMRDCLTLSDWVCQESGVDKLEVDDAPFHFGGHSAWTFGAVVAEATMAGVAAVAGLADSLTDPMVLPQGSLAVSESEVFSLLEELGKQLDCLAQYLFGGLCRAEVFACDGSDDRLPRALRGICAWALIGVGRTIGFEQLTASLLWEWCSMDCLWVLVLAKGVLTLQRPEELSSSKPPAWLEVQLACPHDIDELQEAVALAVIGLPHPTVAFAKDVADGEGEAGEAKDVADGEGEAGEAISIVTRSMQLANHRAQLASSIAESRLVGPLVQGLSMSILRTRRAKLASFIAALLQPDLTEDPPWANASIAAPLVLDCARSASAEFASELEGRMDGIWSVLASVPARGRVPRGFLRDCCDLAYAAPHCPAGCAALINKCIAGRSSAEIGLMDPVIPATLIALATNAKLPPFIADGADGGLAEMLGHLSLFQRPVALEHLVNWRGCLHRTSSEYSAWLDILNRAPDVQHASGFLVTELEAPLAPSPAAPAAERTALLPNASAILQSQLSASSGTAGSQEATGGLRALLCTAPEEFRCALDGRLLTDPVRSPQGLVFERSVLAQRLAEIPGICPITGQPLSLETCQRDHALRQCAVRWVREQRAARPPRQKQLPEVASKRTAAARNPQEEDEANYDTLFGE